MSTDPRNDVSNPDWFDTPGDEGAPGGAPARPAVPPRKGRLAPTLLILAVLAVLAAVVAELLTEVWWYDSVGYRSVFVTELATKVVLFVLGAALTATVVALALWQAYKHRPLRIAMTPAEQVLEQYRRALEPLRRPGLVGVPVVLGLLAGAGAMGAWRAWLLWVNAQPFGRTDPQFGLDIGFYIFELPWWRFVVSFATVMLVLGLIASAFTNYVYGGLQLPGRGPTSRAAFVQLGTLGALLALVRGAGYWLDRYGLQTESTTMGSRNATFTGITWTGSNAVIPTKTILAAAAVICAALFLAAIWTASWRLPIIGVSLLVVVSVLVGSVYPALIQSLKVRPSEQSLERDFIQRNMDSTRTAFGLDSIASQAYAARTTAPADSAPKDKDAAALPGIRLMDPNVVAASFRQRLAYKQYYTFADSLDIDRYTVDGESHDAVVGVREINLEGIPQRNWINDHTVYTHGYGFVAAYGNRKDAQGDPVYLSDGLGEDKDIGTYEPRVYFGERSPEYSIVGAPAGSKPREVDYPDPQSSGEVNNTYQGKGGVEIGSAFRQAVYAIKYREPKFVLSDVVNDASRLLDNRDPKERVARAAPWLTLDDNVYPAVVDGRIQWIVEGFTTSADYPSSNLVDLATAIADTTPDPAALTPLTSAGEINYVRNSVKATVDAFDGSVRLYAWDDQDPLLKAWSAAFPGTVRPMSEISASLMAHLRYPADLLKIQRNLFTRYHVGDPSVFYSGQDNWRIPSDPSQANASQPVYYQSIAMPDMSGPAFSVTSTFVPAAGQTGGREILRGFLSVDADAGTTAGKRSEAYGKMRLLVLPGDTSVSGPGQVQNRIETSAERSQNPTETFNLRQYISQAKANGSTLIYGNLLTLPFGGGFLYVQPLYVQASKESGSFPQLKAVVAMFGDKLAWGDTLGQAIGGIFGGADIPGQTPTEPQQPTKPAGTAAQQMAAAIADIQAAYAAGQEALKAGDFAGYGAAQAKLEAALKRLQALAPEVTGQEVPAPTPSPSPSGSPAP